MMHRLSFPLKLAALLLIATPALSQNGTAAPYRLTLADAIHRGLQANLGVLVAETRIHETEATAERRQSLLLPRVRVEAPVAVQSRSLAAQGISVPGLPLPQVVGPFSTYEARAYAEQPIVDLQSLHALRSARQSTASAKSDYQDARDLVIRNVAALYLSAQSQFAETVAAQSRVETAQALYKLAAEQRDAGVATGIDVLRAQVELANERQALVQARNRAKGALLALARNIGMSPGTEIELADPLAFHSTQSISVESVLPQALESRPDYQSLQRTREALVEQLRASRARYLPKLTASGNYGGIGRTLNSVNATGAAQLSLSVTVFDRDREGEAAEITARIQRAERQMNDARLGVEQELRQAMLNIESAAEEVIFAEAGLELAKRELDLAQLRFSQGVTNNIEVISAQDALSRAQQNSIVALTHHADARISLARAMGNTEASYADYLGSR
ncbi:MAG TPA: TolC family protein [Candidatus Saccharimonadales bacterium]|nr:TolC family protein [Candidatus Saccharimonadales bacterium]